MIKSYKELKRVIKQEKRLYKKRPYYGFFFLDLFVNESNIMIWKYQRLLRIEEFLYNNRKNIFLIIPFFVCERKKNILGTRLGIYIPCNVFDEGLFIDHYGSITVNGNCKVGKNARLHGNNCIGNKGIGREDEYPVLGDDVDMGFGSCIIGDVVLGNNVIVGTNSVVTKSFGNYSVVVGVPAKKIN